MSDYEEHHFKAPPSAECGQRVTDDAPRTLSPTTTVGMLIAQRLSALHNEIAELEVLRDSLPAIYLRRPATCLSAAVGTVEHARR